MIALIAICMICAIVLIVLAGSQVEGPAQRVTIGGTMGPIQNIRLPVDRFSGETQRTMNVVADVFFAIAAVTVGLLVLYQKSWTEIYSDSVRACSMGKTVDYPIENITKIENYLGLVQVDGTAGKVILVTRDARKALKILEKLIFERKRVTET